MSYQTWLPTSDLDGYFLQQYQILFLESVACVKMWGHYVYIMEGASVLSFGHGEDVRLETEFINIDHVITYQ